MKHRNNFHSRDWKAYCLNFFSTKKNLTNLMLKKVNTGNCISICKVPKILQITFSLVNFEKNIWWI